MPRIDPHQLLTCLTVLLTPTGGILSKNEVQRLANLMTKFSKKLVSKCVYVLILKNTELPLLGAFMVEGGWNLVHVWLQDGYNNKNWALVSELLELLLMSPTTVEQLKTNNLPKLVKSLSKREDLEKVKDLANQLVQKWLKIVKEDQKQNTQTVLEKVQSQVPQAVNTSSAVPQPIQVVDFPVVQVEQAVTEKACLEPIKDQEQQQETVTSPTATQACYKLAVRDGKHILCKVTASEANVTVVENAIIEDITPEEQILEKNVEKKEEVDVKDEKDAENKAPAESEKRKEKSNHDRQKSKSSSSKSSSSDVKSSRDKDRRSHNSRDKSRDKSRSSSKSKDRSSRDSSKDKSKSDKDKHRSNGSVKGSSSRNSSSSSSSHDKDKTKEKTKEKQAEKDKDTLTKIQPQTLQKLGRIPKKSSEDKEEKKEDTKKPSFSIEVRKSSEEKPKTVKVYNAKMRSTGLLEEAKPPPPRPVKKAPATLPAIPPVKRPSPIRDLIPPPEKKVKIETPIERPGAIKLIPPKPKPPILQESDIFMDALAASASTKKEPKKRKRRMSTSKESTTSSPPASPSVSTALTNGVPTATTTQMTLRGITPANFYQDTLETTDCADDDAPKEEEEKPSEEITGENPPTPTDNEEKMDVTETPKSTSNDGDLKGVLVHVRKKGPKKTLKWKCEAELVDVQYFELDETERVNVSKPFGDMARMEITSEKHTMQLRKVHIDDNMGVQIPWRPLIEIDLKSPLAEPGSKSLEKDIQFAREKSFIGMSPLMHRYAETPAEPDVQQYQMTDHVIIPLEDPENSDPDALSQPWPEPKGSPPQVPIQNLPPMFPNIQAPFQNFGGPPPTFQNGPFGAPNYGPPPNMMGPGGPNVGPPGNPHEQWNNPMNNPMNNMNNPMNAPMNNGPMMPPNCPPEMMNPGPPMFPPKHPDNFNQQNMNEFPPHFNQPNMFPQNNFNMRGRGGFRGGRGNNGPWVRMNGPGPGPGGWNHRGGGMNRGGRVCKNVKNFGYCRNRDTCPFFHPN